MHKISFLLLTAILFAATLVGGCGYMLVRTKRNVVLAISVSIVCCLTVAMICAPVGGLSKQLFSAETSEMESTKLESALRQFRIQNRTNEWNIYLHRISLEQVPPRYLVSVRFECNKVSLWNRSRIVSESEYIERCLKAEWNSILQD